MFITNPGVQKPHCDPLFAAIAYCTGSSFSRVLPIPSVVVIMAPSSEQSGRRHELTAVSTTRRSFGSQRETITVQAPHPPSPPKSFLPVNPIPSTQHHPT